MTVSMHLTHLIFRGPRKPPAHIEFNLGLNLVYGSSNTGKSSIFDAIDFMLGREGRDLKEIPEHDGYEEILLGIKFSSGDAFTLARSLMGGNFSCFEGTHLEKPEGVEPTILRPKKPSKKIGSLADFILGKLDLADKELKKNQRNEKASLTLRNLAPLFLINETDIQKEGSPYFGGQVVNAPVEKSRLRFLLTGVDDSALVPEEKEREVISRQARLHLLAEFIDESQGQILQLGGGENFRVELEEQHDRLAQSLFGERETLSSSEAQYRQVLSARSALRRDYADTEDRLAEISEMLARFQLLKGQYETDLKRLENIREAGTLFVALPSDRCPFCGAKPEDHDPMGDCDSTTDEIVRAAEGEQAKIRALQIELADVIETLEAEELEATSQLPEIREELERAEAELRDVSPQVSAQRSQYAAFLDEKSEVERNMELFENLDRLQQKQKEIEEESKSEAVEDEVSSKLPTKPLYDLSDCVRSFIEAWGLVLKPTVHFDNDSKDFVINGKHRASNGKGHRAITHAAATLGLLRYTEQNELPYPGFVILDSPLLAYEEPENDEDDLSGTDVNLRFLRSLSSWQSSQVVVLENRKSIPDEFEDGDGITHFTKSHTSGRYGFFPVKQES